MYETSKIVIQNNLDSIEPLIAYIQSVARQLKLNEKERYRICYAIEESLQKSILFDFESGSVEEIEIEVSRIASGLKVIIFDHGIPKNPFKDLPASVEDLASDISFESIQLRDSDQLSAVSDFVIHKLLDRYTYINRGKEGRSIEMLIYASEGLFKEKDELNHHDDTKLAFGHFSSLRFATKSDLTGISRLFYKSYGYTYVNDLVYYPERLMKAIESGTLVSCVALSETNRVIGHIALMQPHFNSKITEWGMAMSDPLFRGERIMSQLIKKIMLHAESSEYRGIFAHSVTNHEFTQKICAANHFSTVALLVGYASSELSFKNIHNKLSQRESTIIDFKLLKPLQNIELFLPSHHKEMILKLYKGLNLEIKEAKAPLQRAVEFESKLRDSIISSINMQRLS